MSRRPRLRRRIREAELPAAVARTFRENLDQFVFEDEEEQSVRRAVAERLLSLPEGVSLAPFDALYPYAPLFLSACLTVAVADGTYSVEDARRISAYAHRLGFSARQLADLEHRVFADLRARGESKLARDRAALESEGPHAGDSRADDPRADDFGADFPDRERTELVADPASGDVRLGAPQS